MYAAKLVYNTNNFTQIAGEAQSGLPVGAPGGRLPYNIGFEEWLNNDTLKEHKLGYLDCYRATRHPNRPEDVVLFMYDDTNAQVYSVGILIGVKQLFYEQIEGIRAILEDGDYIDTVQNHFNAIGDIRPIINNPNHEYWRCYSANNIVATPGNNFILNISYESIEFFEQRQNLSDLTQRQINSSWGFLSRRYNMIEEWAQHFL